VPEVIASARQGLALGGPAEVGYDKGTLPYVPGSTVRGALATTWIQQNGIPDASNPLREEFLDLFERDIRYGPLFQQGTAVTPLSAVWCKYPSTSACAAWSADAVVDGDITTCPHCGKGTDTGKGEVTGVRVRRILRTSLDKEGRAVDGNLFARHELESGLTYRGRLAGQHPWLMQPREIWLGGRTSTCGLADIRVTSEPAGQAAPPIAGSPRPDGALVIRLSSPAVVVDDAGRATLDPAKEILRVLGMEARALRASRCWTRPVRIGGWHAASGLPKPVELAMSMGSAVVLHFDRQPSQDQLRRLASDGVGLRRIEGFGTVDVNPPRWQRPAVEPSPQPTEKGPAMPSIVAPLSDLALLQDETVVRWLVDRCRMVLVERERDPGFRASSLLTERVAVYFDDAQADAVSALFASQQLPAAIPILEQALDHLIASDPGAAPGGQP
jgi:CRISPR-associated protein Csx10